TGLELSFPVQWHTLPHLSCSDPPCSQNIPSQSSPPGPNDLLSTSPSDENTKTPGSTEGREALSKFRSIEQFILEVYLKFPYLLYRASLRVRSKAPHVSRLLRHTHFEEFTSRC